MEADKEIFYHVVINEEKQYSIWPTFKTVPIGWSVIGIAKNKADCLAYIKEIWTDMRPLSLRKEMEK